MSQAGSRTGLWAGLAVAAVLTCVGGAAGAVAIGNRLAASATDGSSPTVPRTPVGLLSPAPLPSASKSPTITVTAPDRLGGRAKLTDEEHQALAEQVKAAILDSPYASEVVVGYYGTADPRKNKIYLAAITAKVPMGRNHFEANFEEMLAASVMGEMADVADTEPGALGGYARCGNFRVQDIPVAACAWGDEGSFGLITWYNRTVAQVKAEFTALRAEVEHKV